VAAVDSVVAVHREVGEVNSLTASEHDTLTKAIQSLERNVTGELVVVVAKSSDSYQFIPTLWAALFALLLPGFFLLIPGSTDTAQVYLFQVTLFFGLLLLFHWDPIQRLIVPSAIMRERATRFAREQFLAQRLHHTNERYGAMVFISLMEHHAEIMVDKGLSDKVDDDYWQLAIVSMLPLLKQGKTAAACEIAIEAVAEKMTQHARRKNDSPNQNELPDHVIEL